MKPSWLKPIDKSDFETIDGKELPFVLDPKGYFLIKVDHDKKTIHAGHCNKNHKVMIEIVGTRAQDVYGTIIKKKLVSKLEHAAYLGKELKKAELAIKRNLNYIQDEDLDFENKSRPR